MPLPAAALRLADLDDVPESMSSCLRRRTRSAHEAAEVALDVCRLHDTADLVRLLRGWQGIWAEVHTAARSTTASDGARDELLVPAAAALTWLAADLGDLGATKRPHAPGIGATDDALRDVLSQRATSWGVAYVLLGARLGGAVIAPRVAAALGLGTDVGTTFFSSGGTKPGRAWAAFRSRLNGWDFSPHDRHLAVGAAEWAFAWVSDAASASLVAVDRVPA